MTDEQRDLLAVVLRHEMERFSEDYWAAGWITDLEYILWSWTLGANQEPWLLNPRPHDDQDADILRLLAHLAGGWWAYNSATMDVEFIPLDEWQDRYAARKASR